MWEYALKNPHNKGINIGKWLLFVETNKRNEIWHNIVSSLKTGPLSRYAIQAKIALKSSFNKYENKYMFVICVYLPDSNNIEDVQNTMKEIRKIKQNGTFFYKTNEQTRKGIYSGNKQKPYIYISYNYNHFNKA